MLSKNSRLGMKYPESRTMGGRRKRKNMFGSSWYSAFFATAKTMPPRPSPSRMRRQLSGTTDVTFLDRWKTRRKRRMRASAKQVYGQSIPNPQVSQKGWVMLDGWEENKGAPMKAASWPHLCTNDLPATSQVRISGPWLFRISLSLSATV